MYKVRQTRESENDLDGLAAYMIYHLFRLSRSMESLKVSVALLQLQ